MVNWISSQTPFENYLAFNPKYFTNYFAKSIRIFSGLFTYTVSWLILPKYVVIHLENVAAKTEGRLSMEDEKKAILPKKRSSCIISTVDSLQTTHLK